MSSTLRICCSFGSLDEQLIVSFAYHSRGSESRVEGLRCERFSRDESLMIDMNGT